MIKINMGFAVTPTEPSKILLEVIREDIVEYSVLQDISLTEKFLGEVSGSLRYLITDGNTPITPQRTKLEDYEYTRAYDLLVAEVDSEWLGIELFTVAKVSQILLVDDLDEVILGIIIPVPYEGEWQSTFKITLANQLFSYLDVDSNDEPVESYVDNVTEIVLSDDTELSAVSTLTTTYPILPIEISNKINITYLVELPLGENDGGSDLVLHTVEYDTVDSVAIGGLVNYWKFDIEDMLDEQIVSISLYEYSGVDGNIITVVPDGILKLPEGTNTFEITRRWEFL